MAGSEPAFDDEGMYDGLIRPVSLLGAWRKISGQKHIYLDFCKNQERRKFRHNLRAATPPPSATNAGIPAASNGAGAAWEGPHSDHQEGHGRASAATVASKSTTTAPATEARNCIFMSRPLKKSNNFIKSQMLSLCQSLLNHGHKNFFCEIM